MNGAVPSGRPSSKEFCAPIAVSFSVAAWTNCPRAFRGNPTVFSPDGEPQFPSLRASAICSPRLHISRERRLAYKEIGGTHSTAPFILNTVESMIFEIKRMPAGVASGRDGIDHRSSFRRSFLPCRLPVSGRMRRLFPQQSFLSTPDHMPKCFEDQKRLAYR